MPKKKPYRPKAPTKMPRDREPLTDAEENMRAIESPQVYDDREPVMGLPRWLKNTMQRLASLFHTSKGQDAHP